MLKKLILKELLLLSKIEKKARRISFHPKLTIIQGDNHTGKSSLIKSIFLTFGATPEKVHHAWSSLNVISFIKFSLDGEDYSLLHLNKKFFAAFDANSKLLGTFESITNDLGPFLADLFNFKLELNNRQNTLVTPPPAYFLLPFYVDQDSSWGKNWATFKNLNQLSNWKMSLIEYHTGIKPNEFYLVKAKIEQAKEVVTELETKKTASQNVLTKLQAQFDATMIDFDIEVFKKEIEEILIYYKKLKDKGEHLRSIIVELNNHKISILNQIDLVKTTINNLQKDYEYALDLPEDVECPTCGTHYENSFAERFDIAKDEDRCQELLETMHFELKGIEERIHIEYLRYAENTDESEKIKELLEKKQGEIKLRDLIQNEGKKELKSILEIEINEIKNDIFKKQVEIQNLREELKLYTNKERKDKIVGRYRKYMQSYLNSLNVNTLPEKVYKKIEGKFDETGSGSPRAYLAYYYECFA
ncbi:hypothetical protein ACTHSJ_33120 [Paenibacillus cellulositrophicus]|uniref:hypothetical protein n=1 Tax=Paenibacillus cellulositrophicus TaxID=562959 RepID=UPI003F80BFC2